MRFLNKVLFYFLILLLPLLHLSPIKAELISNKSERNYILQENQDKSENSFQKNFPEKSLQKDEIFKRKKDRNFVDVSKETEKKEKSIIKEERDEKNPRKLTDEENYIIVHYGSDASYSNGYRTGANGNAISKIMYNGGTFQYNSPLTITAGTYIEIYISSSVTALNNFFARTPTSTEHETNCEKIISIDLSHLKSLSLTDIDYLFYMCNGFKALDMSGIKLSSVTSTNGFLYEVSSLIYLNIKNTELGTYMASTLSSTFTNDYPIDLIVCQSEDIITVTKFQYKCCNFLPEAGECGTESTESTIHIDIYFGEDVQYQQGFDINTASNHRDTVVFLKSGDNSINLGDSFNINSGDKLEIYFSSNVTTLESFFDCTYDPLTEKIVSIDFSNFNISGFVISIILKLIQF